MIMLIVLFFPSLRFFPLGFHLQGFNEAVLSTQMYIRKLYYFSFVTGFFPTRFSLTMF
jgi:hypothetical protein